jgi:BirA family transcriptional regulator, biotin operon repressor / biotin---[acetyl-CoA-carboxylase] ligase
MNGTDDAPLTTHHSPSEEWTLPTSRIGRRVVLYDCLESTNTLALALASDARQDGLVVLAREQTAGRGQYGRSWLAPPGSSVLLSTLVFPPPALRRPVVLTAWAAVSLCALVKQFTGKPPRIKWPNDVQASGRKLAGILIEQRAAGPDRLATVLGIGVNVAQPAAWFEQAGLTEATSLACLSDGAAPDYPDVARRLVRILDEEYSRLLDGDLGTLEGAWQRHLGLLGKPARLELHTDETVHGRIHQLTFNAVELDVSGDTRFTCAPERIKHIQPLSE